MVCICARLVTNWLQKIIAKITVNYFGKEDIPVSLNNQLREKYKSFPDYGRETDQMLLESKCRSDVEEYIKKMFSGNQRPIVQTLLNTIRDKEAKLYWTDSMDRDYEQLLKMDIYTMVEFINWMHIKVKYARFKIHYQEKHENDGLSMEEFKEQYKDYEDW